MNTTFMNSKNSKASCTTHGKNSYKKKVNLKYQLQHGIINLNYQMDHILFLIFKIILSISSRNMEKKENRITFRIKKGYYLEIFMPETMKLLRSREQKID